MKVLTMEKNKKLITTILLIIIIIGVYYLSFQIYVQVGKYSAKLHLKELEFESTLKEIDEIEGKYRQVQESIVQVQNELNKNRLKLDKVEEMIEQMEKLVELIEIYEKARGD